MKHIQFIFIFLLTAVSARDVAAQAAIDQLPTLQSGRVGMQNALWIESDPKLRFVGSKRVVVAEIEGPAMITMIHFAMPGNQIIDPKKYRLNRDLLLKIYWDGEKEPSVDCPFVDFFCDPAGVRDEVNTALVNKRRGWNAYFPMPFRKSARVELVYDGPMEPGEQLFASMPCYSYVMYRTLENVPDSTGYFHASWRQEDAQLGTKEYLAFEAKGKGKFIGWNLSIRNPFKGEYYVDENEKFFIDGEKSPSVEFQGLEDAFGFSYGFPETENEFPAMGYYPFLKGAFAYRFFLQDAISFEHSLRVSIGFGPGDLPEFVTENAKQENRVQFSTTAYWYQVEPHAALPAMPLAAARVPAPESKSWPNVEQLPSPESLKDRGVKLQMLCGRPEREIIFNEQGYSAVVKQGNAWSGWAPPIYYCRSSSTKADDALEVELSVPQDSAGTVRLYVVDPDNFGGGRKQTVSIAGKTVETVEGFQQGRWLERTLTREETAQGKIPILVANAREGSNAVLSVIEWVEMKK